jgi:hypothetical protein
MTLPMPDETLRTGWTLVRALFVVLSVLVGSCTP